MQAYRASGTFPNGQNIQPFSMDLVAVDEVDARHRIYSFFGSRHNIRRRTIKIDTLESINPSDSTEPVVIAAFREGDPSDAVGSKTATAAEEE